MHLHYSPGTYQRVAPDARVSPSPARSAIIGGAMLIRLLRTFLRPYRLVLAGVLVLQVIQAGASLYLPNLNADIIDKGVMHADQGYIWRIGGVMLAVTLVQMAFSIAAVYFGSRAAMSFGRDVRSALFHRVTDFSAQEVNALGAPSLITRITNDVQQVQLLVVMTCTLALAAPITAIGGVVMAMRQDLGLSWLLGVSMPLLLISAGSVVWRMVPQFRIMQERIDNINRVVREQITGIRVVRAFVREPQEVRRFANVNAELTKTSLVAGRLMALMFPIVLLIINGSSVALIWFGGDRIARGQMTIGSLIAFLTYFSLILTSVMMATFVAIMAPRAAVCAERIQEVLDTSTSVAAPSTPVTAAGSLGTIEFRDVTFGYPGAESPVLSNLSLRTAAGQTTAIIGSTGSGKTSLINLVARLFDVTRGEVLVGNVDVRDLDPAVLWNRIGLVPQKPYLFSGTIRSNLQYGKPDATEAELWEALEIAQAADFVRVMPGGLDASIDQGGTNVSGGQRQRLAIARALVRRPDIYLFDDSFSALDLATDARLRTALAPFTRDAAVVVVAQRVSTIRNADQILVLEDGVIVGLGTHAELLGSCPTYVEIVESQMSQDEAA
jgi:ATP-binding cassette subfamily B multidrug efflux pump